MHVALAWSALVCTGRDGELVLHRGQAHACAGVERAETGCVNGIGAARDDGPGSVLVLGWQLQAADERCAAAEARLGGIRTLLVDIGPDAARGIPDAPESWQSRASAAYTERLRALSSRLDAALGALHEAEAAAWRELVGEQEERERLRALLQGAGSSLADTGPGP